MSYDVIIEIYGEIKKLGAFEELIEAAEEGALDYGEPRLSADEAAEAIIIASSDGESLKLYRQDTRVLFDEVTAVCEEHGLSYLLTYGDSGDEGYDRLVSYDAQTKQTREYSIDGDAEVSTVTIDALKKAAAKGIEEVQNLIAANDTSALLKAPKRLSVHPDVIDAYKAEVDEEIEDEDDAAPGMRR